MQRYTLHSGPEGAILRGIGNREELMKDIDDLKAEIDEISKKIDTIVENVERLDPTQEEPEEKRD
jgi:archaellum component FlaC